MREVPEDVLNTARRLREEGESWNSISRALGFDRDVLRWRIDPDFVSRRKVNHGGPPSMIRSAAFKPSQEEIYRMLDAVPPDTRSFTGRALGDPLPGRSALDRRRTTESKGGPYSPIKAERTYFLRGFLAPRELMKP